MRHKIFFPSYAQCLCLASVTDNPVTPIEVTSVYRAQDGRLLGERTQEISIEEARELRGELDRAIQQWEEERRREQAVPDKVLHDVFLKMVPPNSHDAICANPAALFEVFKAGYNSGQPRD